MKKIIWHRRKIYLEEYKKNMGINNFSINSEERLKEAYKAAFDTRKFEIELFWKRATFFWAFITAIYTAYFNVLIKVYPVCEAEHPPYQHGTIPLLVLSFLGLFFSFSWLLSSYASKNWQENWENHIDLLENDVTGPLYKIYESEKAFSVSRITIAAGWVVSLSAYALLIYEFSCFVLKHITKKGVMPFYLVLCFAILIAILMFIFSKIMKGNQNKSGIINFQIKEF